MSKYPGRIVTDLAPAGYSVALDGTGDYLNASPTALGSGNFTIECWVYLTGSVASKGVFHVATSSVLPGTVSGVAVASGSSGGWTFYYNNGTQNTNTSLTAALNTWIHIAVVKSGTTISLYINGILNQSQTDTANYTNQVAAIGGFFSTAYLMTGNISNFRMVNSALYSGTSTTTANFNLPTQLLNITGTSLLTCNSPAIVDQSTNNFTITANGNAAVSTFTPFTAYVPYNPALGASTPGVWTVDEAMQAAATRQWNMYDPNFQTTTLLLHGNGANNANNNTFLDSSSNNFTITRFGNTTQGSFSPFSQVPGYWSNYFDGTDDRLSVPDNAKYYLGSSNFTIEAWVYNTAWDTTNNVIFEKGAFATGKEMRAFFDQTQIRIELNVSTTATGAYTAISIATTNNLNQWYHVAFTRSGNTVYIFRDGVLLHSAALAGTIFDTSEVMAVGGAADGNNAIMMNGYISNLRFTIGQAFATSSFTPPNSPLTTSSTGWSISGSSVTLTGTVALLLCQGSRFLDASANPLNITVGAGTPSIQPFSPFYPTAAYTPQTIGGSAYFDGTGDYLDSASNVALQLGSGDFSIEWWEYRDSIGADDTPVSTGSYSSAYAACLLGYSGTVGGISTNGSSWNVFNFQAYIDTLNAKSWNHFVYTRSGTAFRAFMNGKLSNYATGSGSVVQNNNTFSVGGNAGGGQYHMPGYISGFRVVKGSIPTSYQTSSTTPGTVVFTPPTAPPTTTSQGATANNVGLVLNFTNAGVVDSTGDNVLETVGNAQISTAVSRFGGSSIAFDGTGDALVAPNSANWDMGSGNYTIEFWVYMNTLTGNQTFIARANTASIYATFDIGWYSSGLRLYVSNNGSTYAVSLTSSISPVATTWTHIAVTRNGSTYTIWVNGVSGGTATDSGSAVANGNNLGIGGYANAANSLNGYIDELRITKGFARYTGPFTPQTSQWQDQ